MSRRGIQIHANREEDHLKYENEPEEGEIIDDYDLIVSSDEELSMRQRILELEAENEEIEQIAVISRSYVDKINHSHNHLENIRAAQVPTDVSSISSTEFVTPQKRKRRKSKERKRRHCHRQYPREHSRDYDQTFRYDLPKLPRKTHSKKVHCKRRQKLIARKHKKFQSERFIHKDINPDDLTLESLESSDSSSVTDIGSCSSNCFKLKKKEYAFNKEKYITRDTLRMAVARNTSDSKSLSNKCCLKDKLLKQELVGQTLKDKEYAYVEKPLTRFDNDDDDDVQVIENEPIIQTIDEDSTDSMEEKELRLIALKSAVLKKHMARKMRNAAVAYSPTDFDEMLNSGILQPDNKMDSIDIVDLETEDSQQACVTISPEASPQLIIPDDQDESQQMMDCKPVDMDIANSDSEDATTKSWPKDVSSCIHKYSTASYDFVKSIQYGIIMQKLQELPPPPPGVDDYEDVPPPPSPYHLLYDAEMQDMDVENGDFTENQEKLGEKEVFNSERKQINADTEVLLQTTNCNIKEEKAEDDDEEEEALRALLLSKFQSPKNQKKSSNHKEVNEFKNKYPLKLNEFSSQNHCDTKPTEIILKEAVKRLKIHSQTETFKEEKSLDSYMEQNIRLNDNIQVFSEKSRENVLDKLRDRLNLYKNQSHLDTDSPQGNANKLLSGTSEFVVNTFKDDKNGQTQVFVTGEVNSAIDISDITRRLQRIKENVLNSIPKVAENSHIPNGKSAISESIRELRESSMENVRQLSKPIKKNIVHTVPTSKDLNSSVTKKKTVEANFDVFSNQTSTLKVTIKNNDAFVSEKNETKDTFFDAIHKEIENKAPENLPSKNYGTGCKSHLNNERSVETTHRAKTSHAATNVQANKLVSSAKSATDFKIAPQTKYSLIRATKIVKPNKVINNNFNLNQKQVSKIIESPLVSNAQKSETEKKLITASDSSRLITSMDQIKHMCKVAPFIINIQNSSNESSEEEAIGDYNSLYKPVYDYNDNASPLSLNLESPSLTPLRSNSPIDSSAEAVIVNSNMEAFNLKPKETPKPRKSIVKTTDSDTTTRTPLAVRHLPAAAQTEYRNLVHRMKLLENKRKLTSTVDNKEEKVSTEQSTTENANKSDTTDYVQKSSLVKKVLIKNASSNTTSSAVAATFDTNVPNKTSKLHKSSVLRSYENLYVKFGAGIVNNLDKSLKLVEEAKKAKIAKIKLETRLKELKAEMDILQNRQKEEQQKISRIYPSICSTNEFIASLKQKRSKIFKAALTLGKVVKGDIYRLNNDLKEVITTKSKKLASEIKIVNSLKAQDIKNKDESMDSQCNADQQIAETEKKNIAHCMTNSEENNRGIEIYCNAFTNSEIVSSKTRAQNGEKSTAEPLLKTETCGNTEFQNLENSNSKNCELTKDSPRPELNTEFNEASSEMDLETTTPLSSYKSPLEHLRNIDCNVDPNGVVCPFDLMGNCEDVTCKYTHISPKEKT